MMCMNCSRHESGKCVLTYEDMGIATIIFQTNDNGKITGCDNGMLRDFEEVE